MSFNVHEEIGQSLMTAIDLTVSPIILFPSFVFVFHTSMVVLYLYWRHAECKRNCISRLHITWSEHIYFDMPQWSSFSIPPFRGLFIMNNFKVCNMLDFIPS